MKHLGLFEGIGGFSLAARWVGLETLAWCEWNQFGQKVLKYHFPNAEGFSDITKTDFKKYANKIDIITGGFPCQPYSVAGKRLGKEDERHLWPEMLRAIREVKPRWVVAENVRGLVNWSEGLVFEEVQTDLENEGYEVQTFILPACGVNAPHRRDRIWFVAYSNNKGRNSGFKSVSKKNGEISQRNENSKPCNPSNFFIANTFNNGLQYSLKQGQQRKVFNKQKRERLQSCSKCIDTIKTNGIRRTTSNTASERFTREKYGIKKPGLHSENSQRNDWHNFPTQSPICSGDDGIPTRLDGITFPKWRNESIKAYGNAIVPQVAFEIFKAIIEYESQN